MLERLIESKRIDGQKRTLRRYILSVGTLVSCLFVCGLIVSIFSTNLAMGTGSIELSTLVAPMLPPDNAPPLPETPDNRADSRNKVDSRLPQRAKNIQRPDETPVSVPKAVSTAPNKFKARPKSSFIVSDLGDRDGAKGPGANPAQAKDGGQVGFGTGNQVQEAAATKNQSPPVKTSTPPPPLKNIVVTGGVMNGKAKSLVIPVVSASAKAVGAKGTVKVNILISETGRVLSANASGGHALLRPSAVTAALKTTFTPTYLSDVPVKVRGLIIYNFK